MNVRPRPVMRWRWWLMAITAVLVVRRLKGPSSSPSRAIAEKLPPERSSASPQLPPTNESRSSRWRDSLSVRVTSSHSPAAKPVCGERQKQF